MEPVTAVLLNWRRPWNIPLIIDSLLAHKFISEIVIFDNSNRSAPASMNCPRFAVFKSYRLLVILSRFNYVTYGRFIAARAAKHEIIFTQDDDCVLDHDYVERLYDRFVSHKRRITHGLGRGHFQNQAGKSPWALLGWGGFFLKEWVRDLELWTDAHGVNELLLRKADRIFTTISGHRRGGHDTIPASFSRPTGPDGRWSDTVDAIYLMADHAAMTKRAVQETRILLR